MEERHGVESDVAKETMSALVKLVTEICESCDIGQPAAECQLMVLPSKKKAGYTEMRAPTRSGESRSFREACLDAGFPVSVVESNDLFYLSVSRLRRLVYGEVDALESHEQGCSGLRKSQTAAAPT